jgi:hypothetical protein
VSGRSEWKGRKFWHKKVLPARIGVRGWHLFVCPFLTVTLLNNFWTNLAFLMRILTFYKYFLANFGDPRTRGLGPSCQLSAVSCQLSVFFISKIFLYFFFLLLFLNFFRLLIFFFTFPSSNFFLYFLINYLGILQNDNWELFVEAFAAAAF